MTTSAQQSRGISSIVQSTATQGAAGYHMDPIRYFTPMKRKTINTSHQSDYVGYYGCTYDLKKILRAWDKGNKTVRIAILQEFILCNKNKTGPQLEAVFGNGASLFLTRLSAWLRLTYLMGSSISLQLQAISIFISASSGHRFLGEFVEVGGILTSLEILGLSQVCDTDKNSALVLLLTICNSGRKYKELVCESYGVRSVAECLANSKNDRTQDYARAMLYQLGMGNPRYQHQVFKALISLFPAALPGAQQMAAQALRMLLPNMESAITPAIIEPVLSLLKSLNLQVQYEGCELLKVLCGFEHIHQPLFTGLIALLTPSTDASTGKSVVTGPGSDSGLLDGTDEAGKEKASKAPPMAQQQAVAAKLLGVFAATSRELAEKMIHLQVVKKLLIAITYTVHSNSQRHAANTLHYLVTSFSAVSESVSECMGSTLFAKFMKSPDHIVSALSSKDINNLKHNSVRVNLQQSSTDVESSASDDEVDEDHDVDLDDSDNEEVIDSKSDPLQDNIEGEETIRAGDSETNVEKKSSMQLQEQSSSIDVRKELIELENRLSIVTVNNAPRELEIINRKLAVISSTPETTFFKKRLAKVTSEMTSALQESGEMIKSGETDKEDSLIKKEITDLYVPLAHAEPASSIKDTNFAKKKPEHLLKDSTIIEQEKWDEIKSQFTAKKSKITAEEDHHTASNIVAHEDVQNEALSSSRISNMRRESLFKKIDRDAMQPQSPS